jgi:hypothetical protein
MAVPAKENVVVWMIVIPLGIAVNAVFLWGIRDVIDLTNPFYWIFGLAFNVWLYKIGKRAVI